MVYETPVRSVAVFAATINPAMPQSKLQDMLDNVRSAATKKEWDGKWIGDTLVWWVWGSPGSQPRNVWNDIARPLTVAVRKAFEIERAKYSNGASGSEKIDHSLLSLLQWITGLPVDVPKPDPEFFLYPIVRGTNSELDAFIAAKIQELKDRAENDDKK